MINEYSNARAATRRRDYRSRVYDGDRALEFPDHTAEGGVPDPAARIPCRKLSRRCVNSTTKPPLSRPLRNSKLLITAVLRKRSGRDEGARRLAAVRMLAVARAPSSAENLILSSQRRVSRTDAGRERAQNPLRHLTARRGDGTARAMRTTPIPARYREDDSSGETKGAGATAGACVPPELRADWRCATSN